MKCPEMFDGALGKEKIMFEEMWDLFLYSRAYVIYSNGTLIGFLIWISEVIHRILAGRYNIESIPSAPI